MDNDDTCSTISASTATGTVSRTSSTMTSVVTSADGTPAPSVYSYRSGRDGHAMLREIAGRTLNTTNDLYLLPADEGEHGRLDKQHLVGLLSVGGLYVATREFTLGLEHYYNSFDVVHARCTANGVKDFEGFVHEAAKCVRAGGVLLFTEGNLEMQNEQLNGQEPAFGDGGPGQSWLARATFEAYNLMKGRGSYVDAGLMLERWMLSCPDLTDVHSRELLTPVGPWKKGPTPEETQRLQMIGTLMRQNMKEFVRSCKPMFVATGFPPALIERFMEGTDKELDELSIHMYVKWHHAWARRVDGPNQLRAATELSVTSEAMSVDG
ncbi:hypothetical protein EW145_g276 [Phellinidium pouzarii]|uniref:Uncharacterized protein n=1 Tax=Phellinidium pouzarii TaxID=167371 RepID=A0A4S4LIV9_9AGAM|nr:hypothetical protein EW145_g276 [Phellinidium pouzarii]